VAAEPTSPLAQWLGVLGLVQYAPAFAENDIDFAVLPSLSEQDLKDLGVASMGHRKRLLKAIADLGGAAVDHAVPHTAGAARVGEAGGAKPEASAERDAGERRQLTVLFCDMVGFTELASRLDPEQLQKVIGAYEDACAMCIARYDGYVFQRLGDGIVAFFGYPGPYTTQIQEVANLFVLPDIFTRVARGQGIDESIKWGVGEYQRIFAKHKRA